MHVIGRCVASSACCLGLPLMAAYRHALARHMVTCARLHHVLIVGQVVTASWFMCVCIQTADKPLQSLSVLLCFDPHPSATALLT